MTKKKKIILGVGVAGMGTLGYFLWKHIQERDAPTEANGFVESGPPTNIPAFLPDPRKVHVSDLNTRIDVRYLNPQLALLLGK
tara:strand:+ start:638 stop:886 length:249 start_codon:yes stop_codon:yes gene_type:complete